MVIGEICLPKPKILSKLKLPLKVLVKCPICFHFRHEWDFWKYLDHLTFLLLSLERHLQALFGVGLMTRAFIVVFLWGLVLLVVIFKKSSPWAPYVSNRSLGHCSLSLVKCWNLEGSHHVVCCWSNLFSFNVAS
jgi:hypothetical protein